MELGKITPLVERILDFDKLVTEINYLQAIINDPNADSELKEMATIDIAEKMSEENIQQVEANLFEVKSLLIILPTLIWIVTHPSRKH